MDAIYLGQFRTGSQSWQRAREGRIGGSEIAAVLGLSTWESRFSLWHRKMGLAAPVADNEQMRWGRLLEPTVADEYNRVHADDGITATKTGLWTNANRLWQVASPDRIVWPVTGSSQKPDRLVEIKTARDDLGWGEPGTDEVPVYYRAQALWYLDVFGVDRCDVAVLIGGSDYREYVVTADPDESALMRKHATEFVDSLRTATRPDIDAHSETYRIIREQHPDIEPADYPVPMEIAEPYLAALDAHKAAADEKQRATAVLADAMHTCRRAVYLGQAIATRVPGRDGKPPYLRAAPAKEPGRRIDAA